MIADDDNGSPAGLRAFNGQEPSTKSGMYIESAKIIR
jgi:hypothetical protein